MQEFSLSLLFSITCAVVSPSCRVRLLLVSIWEHYLSHLNSSLGAQAPAYKERGKAAADFSGLCLRLHSKKEEFCSKVIAEIYSYIEQWQSTSHLLNNLTAQSKAASLFWSSRNKFCGMWVFCPFVISFFPRIFFSFPANAFCRSGLSDNKLRLPPLLCFPKRSHSLLISCINVWHAFKSCSLTY